MPYPVPHPLLQPTLWPRQLLIGCVLAYRGLLKPWLGSACRFEPTCSAYALTALRRHGAVRGTALSAWRLARCHPWCAGGHDPVPDTPGLLTRLVRQERSAARSLPASASASTPASASAHDLLP